MAKSKRKQAAARDQLVRVPDTQGMSTLERLARDPAVDVGKLERLIGMQERAQAKVAEAAFVEAFLAMQADLPEIDEQGQITDKAGKVQSRYARWPDIVKLCRPIWARHGFALRHKTDFPGADGRMIRTTGLLTHRAGHTETSEFLSPADPSGSKNAIQGIGSTRSYGRRYTALDLLNITSRAPVDRDDDGRAAGPPEALPQPAQRKSQQEAVSAGPARPAGVERNVGTIASTNPRGAGLLATLSTGFVCSTKDPELIVALHDHAKAGRVVRMETHVSSDPVKYAPILDELVVVSETVL